MKFALALLGTRAEREVELPLPDGAAFKTLVRPLTGTEGSRVLAAARAYAVANGATDPKQGDSHFDLGYMANAIAIGCVDPDSPEDDREASFTGGEKEVLALPLEQITYLHEHLELWQDECSPQIKKMSTAQMFEAVAKCAEAEDDIPLLRWGPSLRNQLLRITARLSLGALADKLRFGQALESSGASSKTKPEKKKKKKNVSPSR